MPVDELGEEWPLQRELSDDLGAVHQWADEHEDLFGGVWFENLDEGALQVRSRIVVGLVGGTNAVQQELRRIVGHPAALRFVEHVVPYRQLRDLQDEVSDQLFGLVPGDGSGAYVSGLGVDVIGNRLQVTLSAPSAELRKAACAIAPDRITVADAYIVAHRY